MDKDQKGLTPESTEGALLPKSVLTPSKWVVVIGFVLLMPALWFEGLPYRSIVQTVGKIASFSGSVVLAIDQMWGLRILLQDPKFSDRKHREASGLRPDANGLWLDDALMYRLITSGIFVAVMVLLLVLEVRNLMRW